MSSNKQPTLLSHDSWLDVADFDVASRVIDPIRHLDSAADLENLPISGQYGTVGHMRLIVRLSTDEGGLLIGFEREPEITLCDSVITWTLLDDTAARLTLAGGEFASELVYEHHRDWVDDDFNFTQSSYDDFDFGLWVFELKNNAERQQRLVDQWRSTSPV